MRSLLEMQVGKTKLQVEVESVIDQIPEMLKRGVEYKATLLRVDVHSDDKKGIKMVAHWRITHSRSGPQKGRTFPAPKGTKLTLVKA